jgi:hypothetical protein
VVDYSNFFVSFWCITYPILETRYTSPLVKKVDYEMKSEAGFLSLAEELQSYILSFLPCQDILPCTSVSQNRVNM